MPILSVVSAAHIKAVALGRAAAARSVSPDILCLPVNREPRSVEEKGKGRLYCKQVSNGQVSNDFRLVFIIPLTQRGGGGGGGGGRLFDCRPPRFTPQMLELTKRNSVALSCGFAKFSSIGV